MYLISEEEREQEDPDVRAVDVRIRHDDDAVVPKRRSVELVALQYVRPAYVGVTPTRYTTRTRGEVSSWSVAASVAVVSGCIHEFNTSAKAGFINGRQTRHRPCTMRQVIGDETGHKEGD